MSILQVFTIIGGTGLLICIVSLVALHVLPTGFHLLQDPVSNYAVSRYGFLYHLQAFASGICGACLLALLLRAEFSLPLWGLIALGCYSLSRLLIVGFPTDIKLPRTFKGTVHMILATFTFTGIAFAVGQLTSPLARLPLWSNVKPELAVAALLTEVAAIAFLVVFAVRPLRPFMGLVERGIYLGTLFWLGLVFAQLLLVL